MEVKNVTISKEYLDRIRRFTAIKPRERFTYVPKVFRDLPVEQQPRFTLHPISGEDALRFSDSMHGEVNVENGKALVSVKRGAYVVNVVSAGLDSWENYYDIEGEPVPFTQGIMENLPVELLEELSDAITSRSVLTKEEMLGLK